MTQHVRRMINWNRVGDEATVSSDLTWNSDDPLAVSILFVYYQEESEPVPWTFALSLLEDAEQGTGLGDVKTSITILGLQRQFLLELSSPFGSIRLHTPAWGIENFVDAVHKVMPEDPVLVTDAMIKDLIDNQGEPA